MRQFARQGFTPCTNTAAYCAAVGSLSAVAHTLSLAVHRRLQQTARDDWPQCDGLTRRITPLIAAAMHDKSEAMKVLIMAQPVPELDHQMENGHVRSHRQPYPRAHRSAWTCIRPAAHIRTVCGNQGRGAWPNAKGCLFGDARSSNAASTAAVLRWHGTFAHGTVAGCGAYGLCRAPGADARCLQQHGASRVRLARQLSDDCRFVFGAQAGRHARHLGHPRRPQFAQQ